MDIKVEKRGSFYYAIGKAIGVGLTEKAAIENAEKNAESIKGKHFEEFVKTLWFLPYCIIIGLTFQIQFKNDNMFFYVTNYKI